METLNSLTTKELLKNGERVFFSNSEDCASAFKSTLTNRFCFWLNGKVIFANSSLSAFTKRLATVLQKRGLSIDESPEW